MADPLANRKKDERIEFRLRSDTKQLISRAALLENQSLSDFVASIAVKRSREVIKQSTLIELNAEQAACFAEALEHPPEPNAALREAAEEYRKAVDRGELTLA